MRRIARMCGIGWALMAAPALAIGQAPAAKKATPAVAPDPALQAKLDGLLDAWEAQSAKVRSLDAQFLRQDYSETLGEVTYFEGRALLQGPNLACIDTWKLDLDKKGFADLNKARKEAEAEAKVEGPPPGKKVFYDRVICTGAAIYHYDGSVQQVFEYPLAGAEQVAALQQGPLTFLFDMKKDDLLRRYVFKLVEEKEASYVIQVVPREAIDRGAFEQAVIYLNKKTYLPDLLMLVEPNKNRQIFYLHQIRANVKIPPGNFQHQAEKWKAWKLVRNPPLGEGEAPGGAARDATPAPKAAAKAAAPAAKGSRR